MKQKIIILILLVITLIIYLFSLEKCIDKKISFDTLSFEWICDVKNRAFLFITRNDNFHIDEFLYFSNLDLDVWKYILSKLKKEQLSEIQKIQMYYILKEVYNYSEIEIYKVIWDINQNYKKLNVSLDRIILAENLLTIDYNLGIEDFDMPIKSNLPLLYDDVEFLKIIFDLESERFDSINLAANLNAWYEVLDEEWKKLYVQIMNDLFNKTNKEFSKGTLRRFLDNIPEDF